MGYFRRKIKRGDARLASLQLRAVTATGEWTDASRSDVSPTGYIRFTIDGQIHERSTKPVGIFRDFSDLVDLALLPPDIATPARQAMRWFNDELPVPRLGKQNAICWFRASQQEMIDRAFDLIAALRAAGHRVQQLQTERPGRCVYEDPYQVAAIPWRDTNLEGEPV